MIDFEAQSNHHAGDGSEQDSPGIGPTPFDLLDIPFHQPPKRGNKDDETIPGVLDVIDEAEATPERRTTSLPPSRVAKILSPKPFVDDVAQRLDLTQIDHGRASSDSPRSGPLRLRFEELTTRLRRTPVVSLTWRGPSPGKEPFAGMLKRILDCSSVIDANSQNWSSWQQGSIEGKLWAHGLSQFSLWASLAREEVVSSESEDKLGIWTSLVYSQAHPVGALWARSMHLYPLCSRWTLLVTIPAVTKHDALCWPARPFLPSPSSSLMTWRRSREVKDSSRVTQTVTVRCNGSTLIWRLTPALLRSRGGSAHFSSPTRSVRSGQRSANWNAWLLPLPPRKLVVSVRSSLNTCLSATHTR